MSAPEHRDEREPPPEHRCARCDAALGLEAKPTHPADPWLCDDCLHATDTYTRP